MIDRPPGAPSVENRTTPAGGRRAEKAARRASHREVLVQCGRCGCLGSGRVDSRRRFIFELGRLLSQIENEIDATGFVSDSLTAAYLKALGERGMAEARA